ncbi:DUF3299 domain-containing protein [uncultured Roseibium sp.]|uniref:DUF3299 domain-containing protein n=1 Tax=uncultured Roseibium sp. TaxID=1936171 RepID=UPI00262FB996|nr:DUF3299 domain-containing protein [uncultured Roseibium sp.]
MSVFSFEAPALRHFIVWATASLLSAGMAIAEPRQITFSELPDLEKQSFEDPFRDMENKVLETLRTAVRLEARLASGEVTEDTRPDIEKRATAARRAVEAAGYDVEALLSLRWVVADRRKTATLATNPDLDGAEVSLTGYLIPAGKNDDGFSTGYLVPQIGMCSHVPPPPPNQLVQLSLPELVQQKSLYVPVRVTGVLRNVASDTRIYILDGQSRMISRWSMKVAEVDIAQTCTLNGGYENGLRKRANVCVNSSKRSFDLRSQ